MNTFNKMKNRIANSKGAKALAAGATGALASFGTMAADHSAAIGAAGTDGATNVGAAITVILTIAAVVTGVGIVIKLLGR
ncbi:hypothetical protein A9Q75_05190 [Colwellia psychrerythraea]|uniref:Uncharacterized protein n=1 Tax=Colwellia psychrerythraea TaxID=28229 RepID=A0A1Y5EMF3_COLPS|nr:hypothetical protein A9Q75_05190 [Colwellia psychrerythraea]